MTHQILLYATCFASLASGLVAGVFLAFSDFVMRSLAATAPTTGIDAMQVINRKVYGSVFIALLLGTAPAAAVIAALAVATQAPGAAWLVSGAVIYGGGVLVVTMICNVPMNKRLDAMDQTLNSTQSYWADYAKTWTRWNHLRTASSAVATLCLIVGSLHLVQG